MANILSTIVFIWRSFRFPMTSYRVPKDKTCWSVDWPQYAPTAYEIDLTDKSWADPSIGNASFQPKWNQMDGRIDRRSHQNIYVIKDGFPLNPLGRTGVCLRGVLGRWGPNHAVDAIVTQWKRDLNNRIQIHETTNKPILEFVAIKRRDTGQWAIPGGFVESGESVDTTLEREFLEEAAAEADTETVVRIRRLFESGEEVCRECVKDPRNTDNAWIETVVKLFHWEDARPLRLRAGDDAVGAEWRQIDSNLDLYANHLDFISRASERFGGHF
ncbi:ADP-ribose pyrophosphatase, mitochondrial-like [Oppia nitens]|uniref:ADP-ribose pyrophosphatase, mitochondrial-like n=1 Tax=Oppia nitens TaxID=1686743 RepID=UPI0023DCB136|nr:ADP-ribose pyrophosphatase, mitochondrial-like [Oppia nitens]